MWPPSPLGGFIIGGRTLYILQTAILCSFETANHFSFFPKNQNRPTSMTIIIITYLSTVSNKFFSINNRVSPHKDLKNRTNQLSLALKGNLLLREKLESKIKPTLSHLSHLSLLLFEWPLQKHAKTENRKLHVNLWIPATVRWFLNRKPPVNCKCTRKSALKTGLNCQTA